MKVEWQLLRATEAQTPLIIKGQVLLYFLVVMNPFASGQELL